MKKFLLLSGTLSLSIIIWFFAAIEQAGRAPSSSSISGLGLIEFRVQNQFHQKGKRPNDWFYRQRAYPRESIPAGRQLQAFKDARTLRDQSDRPEQNGEPDPGKPSGQ